jgi:hypothetical protein
VQTGGSNVPVTNSSLIGLTGVTEGNGTIQSSTDPAVTTAGIANFTGFARVPRLNLQYVNFGDWVIRPCAADDCAPVYVVMIGGGAPGVSPTSTMPSGTASYLGLATGIIEQSSDVARFRGDIGLTADFGTGEINGQIAGIQAYDTDTDTRLGTVNDIGLAASISGSSYTGATSVIGRAGNAFDISGASGQISGGFYGPAANETAGVFYLNGGTNNTHLTGAFGAKVGSEMLTQFREVATIGTDSSGLTATLNSALSGIKLGVVSTEDGSPSGFTAATQYVTRVSPSVAFVSVRAGGNNEPYAETVAGRSVTELELSITSSNDPAITTAGGGYYDDFAETAGLSYSSFGTWSIKPCSNATDCTPTYAGTFGGSQGEAYQTAALPTSGSATYAGGATGFVQQPGASNSLNAASFYGTTTLTANFATGSVNGGVSNIVAHDLNTDAALGSVNNIGIAATIAGTGFSGTTNVTGSGGTAFNISGATGTVNGAFFGPNAQEVAGVFNLTGGTNNTTLLGSFGAKR